MPQKITAENIEPNILNKLCSFFLLRQERDIDVRHIWTKCICEKAGK